MALENNIGNALANNVGKFWKTALKIALENGIGKQCWKTALENSVGKWCWKTTLEN
jgi:hypothetical protein